MSSAKEVSHPVRTPVIARAIDAFPRSNHAPAVSWPSTRSTRAPSARVRPSSKWPVGPNGRGKGGGSPDGRRRLLGWTGVRDGSRPLAVSGAGLTSSRAPCAHRPPLAGVVPTLRGRVSTCKRSEAVGGIITPRPCETAESEPFTPFLRAYPGQLSVPGALSTIPSGKAHRWSSSRDARDSRNVKRALSRSRWSHSC